MKPTYYPKLRLTQLLFVLAAAATLPLLSSANPPNTKVVALTPEERQAYAEARERVMEDVEYKAALERAAAARKEADKIFFAKLLKAAPELKDYLLYLQSARGMSEPAASEP
jgi:hypothetical protein